MVVPPAPIDVSRSLSLHDLRSQFRGSLPLREVDRFSNLVSKVPLELLDAVADFAFLGNVTDSKEAKKFREQICQLSGTKNDGHIAEFQTELVEVKCQFESPRQAVFLKPIKASIKKEDQFVAQSPVVIYDSGSEISVVRPSLKYPGKYLITTIYKEINVKENVEKILIAFINLTDEDNLSSQTRFVSEIEYASTVINSVKERMKIY